MLQYKLSELDGFDSIAPNDSIVIDYSDEGIESSWSQLHFILNCRAIELNCEIVKINHIDNFQPPFFKRVYYDTILFQPI